MRAFQAPRTAKQGSEAKGIFEVASLFYFAFATIFPLFYFLPSVKNKGKVKSHRAHWCSQAKNAGKDKTKGNSVGFLTGSL